jgi:hypothetical protein
VNAPKSSSVRGHSLLKILEPVEDNLDLGHGRSSRLALIRIDDPDKVLAVWGDIGCTGRRGGAPIVQLTGTSAGVPNLTVGRVLILTAEICPGPELKKSSVPSGDQYGWPPTTIGNLASVAGKGCTQT